MPQAATRKITGLVPRLRRSDHPPGFPSPSGWAEVPAVAPSGPWRLEGSAVSLLIPRRGSTQILYPLMCLWEDIKSYGPTLKIIYEAA